LTAAEGVLDAVLQAVDRESAGFRSRIVASMKAYLCGDERPEFGGPLRTDARRVEAMLTERGYFAEATVSDGGAELALRMCPLLSVARRNPALCDAELECLKEGLQAYTVTRSAHRLAGAGHCVYSISADHPSLA
jgi:predicted ArsR family transcriptional regulator